jgi:Domain of unknown function (DUF4115)
MLMRTALIVLLVIAGLLGLGVFALRRRERDEIHSIDHYRNALRTLDEMRPPTSSVRILSEDEARELRQPHPGSLIRSDVPPPPGRFFEDGPPGADDEAEVPAGHRRHLRSALHHDEPEWAMSRMQDRHILQNRELLAAAGAIVLLLILIVVGVAIGTSSSKHASSTTAAPSTTSAPRTTTSTTQRLTQLVAQPGFSATAATYYVPGTNLQAVVSASQGPCWTTVSTADNQTLFNGTIAGGASQSFQHAGALTVTLDAPGNVSVSVNGVPVVLPPGYGAPLALSFTAPPATTTTTSTTTTSSTTTTTAPTTTAPPTTQVP